MNEGRSKSENLLPSPSSSQQPKAGCLWVSRVEAQTQSVTAWSWLPGPVLLGGLSQLPREALLLIPEGEVGELTPAWHRALAGFVRCAEVGGPVMEFSVWVCSLSPRFAFHPPILAFLMSTESEIIHQPIFITQLCSFLAV